MEVREAGAADRAGLLALHRAAFSAAEGKKAGDTIATLVDSLLDDPSAQPLVSLVAAEGEALLGHILFTPVTVDGRAGGYILAPLAVCPTAQRGGIGTTLIKVGLELLGQQGVPFVMVLGDPAYYSRSGFAAGHGIKPPHSIPYPEAWMALALEEGALDQLSGTLQCAHALNAPEHW
ncbi:MAG: N-acetyltransferase [Halieaceae bacterium]|jgi:predicted N-acetyltransferase YhbS|nr:N-acetyltransferase [Halieaceae bacterium]